MMPSNTTNNYNSNRAEDNAMVVPADLSLSDWYPLASQVLEALSSYNRNDEKEGGISPLASVRSMPWSGRRSHLRLATTHEVDHQAMYTKQQFVSQLGPVLMESRLEVLLEQSGKAIERANVAATHIAGAIGAVGSAGASLDQSQSVMHRHPTPATSQSTTTALSASYQQNHLDSETHFPSVPSPATPLANGGGGFVLADFLRTQQPDEAGGNLDGTPSPGVPLTGGGRGAATSSISMNTVLPEKHDNKNSKVDNNKNCTPSKPPDEDVSHIFYQQHTITNPSDVVLWSAALLSLLSSNKKQQQNSHSSGSMGVGFSIAQWIAPILPTAPPLLPRKVTRGGGGGGGGDSVTPSSTSTHIIMHPTLQDALNFVGSVGVSGGGGTPFGELGTQGSYSTLTGSRHQNRGGSPFDYPRRRTTREASFSNESPPKRHDNSITKYDNDFKFHRAIPAGEHASLSSVVAQRVVSPVRRNGGPSSPTKVVEDPLTVALREAEESVFNAATSGLKRWHQSISPTRRHRSPPNNVNGPYGTSPPRTAGLSFNRCLSPFDASVVANNIRPSTASENLGLKAASAYLQHFHLQYVATRGMAMGIEEPGGGQPPLPATLLTQLELIASQPLTTSTLGGRLTTSMVAVEQGDLMMKALWRARRDANRKREEAAQGGGGYCSGGRRFSTSGDNNHISSRGGSPPSLRERRRSFETTSAAIAEMHHIDRFLEALGDSVLSFQLQVECMLSNFYDVCVREAQRRFSRSSSPTNTTTTIPPPTYGTFMSVLVDIVAEELRMQRLFPSDTSNNKTTEEHTSKSKTIDPTPTTTATMPTTATNAPDSTDMVEVHPVPEAAISYTASPCLLATHIEGHPRGRSLWEVSQPKAISTVHVSEDLCLTLHRASNQTYAEQHGSNISNSVVYAAEVAESMAGSSQSASGVRAVGGGGRGFILHLRTPQALSGVDRSSQSVQLAHQGVLSFRLNLHLSTPITSHESSSPTSSAASSPKEGSSTHIVAATLSRVNGVVCIATRDCLYFFDIYKEPRGEVIKRLMASEYNKSNHNNITAASSTSSSPKQRRDGANGSSNIHSTFPELQCIAVLPIDSPRVLASDTNTAVSISCVLLREEMLPPTDTNTTQKSSAKSGKTGASKCDDDLEEDGGDDGREDSAGNGVRKASKEEAMPGHLVRASGWINNVCLLVGSSGGQLSVVRPPVWHAAVGTWIPPCFFSSTRLGEAALRGSQPQQHRRSQHTEASVQMLQQETIVSLRPMERGDGYAPSVIFALTTRGSVYAVNVVEGSPCHVGMIASYGTTSSIPMPHKSTHNGVMLAVMPPQQQLHHQGPEKSLVIKAVLTCPKYGMQHVNDICTNDTSDYVVCVGSASFLLVWVAPGRQRRAGLNHNGKGTDGQHPTFGLVVEPRKIDDIHNPHYPQVTRVSSVGTLEGVVSLDAIGTLKWWNLRSLCCLWTIRVGELNAIPSGSNLKAASSGGGGVAGVGAGLNRARAHAKNMFRGSEGGGATLTASATSEGRRDASESSPLTNAFDFTCTDKRLVVVTQRGLFSFLVKGGHLGKQDTTGAVAMPPTSLGIRLRLPQEYRSIHASTGTMTPLTAATSSTHLLSTWADTGDVCALGGISSLFPRGVLMTWRGQQRLLDTPTVGIMTEPTRMNPRAILGQFVASVLYDLHITTTPQNQQLLMGVHRRNGGAKAGTGVGRRVAKRVFYAPSVEFRPERGGSDTTSMGTAGARAGEGGSIGIVSLPIQNVQPSATTTIIDWVHTGSYFALLMSSGDVRIHAAIVGGSDGGGGGLVFVFTHEDLVAAACESCSVVGMSTVQDTFLTSNNDTNAENHENNNTSPSSLDIGVSEDLHDLDEIGCGITYCPLWNRLVVPTRGSWVWFLPLSIVDRARWGGGGGTSSNTTRTEEERKELRLASSSEEDEAQILSRLSKSKGDAQRDRTDRLYDEHREHMKKYKEVLEADGWGDDKAMSHTMAALNDYSDLDDDGDTLLLKQGGLSSGGDGGGNNDVTSNNTHHDTVHKKGWRVARDRRLKREAKIREHKESGDGSGVGGTSTSTTTATSTWGGGQYEDGVPRISVVRGGGYSLFGPFLPDEVAVVRLQGTLTFSSFMYFHASTTTTTAGSDDEDEHRDDGATLHQPSAVRLRAPSSLSSHTDSTSGTTQGGGSQLHTHRPHHHNHRTTVGRAPLRPADPSRGGNSSSGGEPSTPEGMGLDIPLPLGVGGGSPHVRPSTNERRTNCSSAVTHAPYIMSSGGAGGGQQGSHTTTPATSSVAVVTPRYFVGAVDGAVEVFVLQGSTVAGAGSTRQKCSNGTSKKTSRKQQQQDDDSSSQIDCRSVVSGVSSMNLPHSSRQLVKQPFGAFLGPTNSRLTPIPSQHGGAGGGHMVGRHPSDLIPHHRNNSSTNLLKTSTRSSVISIGTPLESRTGSLLLHGSLSHLSSGAFGGAGQLCGGIYNHGNIGGGNKGPHVPISLFVRGRPAILQHIQRIIVSTVPHLLSSSPFMSGGLLHNDNNHGGGGGSSASYFGPSSMRRSWWSKTAGSMPLSPTTTALSDDIASVSTDLHKEVMRITQQHPHEDEKAVVTPAANALLIRSSSSSHKPTSNNTTAIADGGSEVDPEVVATRKALSMKEAVRCCVETRCKKATLTPAEEPSSSQQHQPPRSAATLITCLSFVDPFVLVCSFDGTVRAYVTRHNVSANPPPTSFTTTSANNLLPSSSTGVIGGGGMADDALPPDVRSTLHYTFTARDLYPMHLEIELARCRRAMGALQRARSMFVARGSSTSTTTAGTPIDGGSGSLSPEEADGLPEKDKRNIEDGYRAIMAGFVGSSLPAATATTASSTSSTDPSAERDYGGLALWRQAAIRLQCKYDMWMRNTNTTATVQQPASSLPTTGSTIPHYITCATAVNRPSCTTALRPSEQPCPLESAEGDYQSTLPPNRHSGGSIVVALGDCWGFVSLILLRLPPTPTAQPTPHASNLGSMLPPLLSTTTHTTFSSQPHHHHLTSVLDAALHSALLGQDTNTRISQPGTLAARGGVLLLDRWLAHPVVEEQRRPLTHFDEKHASAFLMSINPYIYFSDRASLLRTDHDEHQPPGALTPSRSTLAGQAPSLQAHQRRRMTRFAGAEGIVVERKFGVQQSWVNEAQGRWLAGEHLCAALTDVAGACILGGPSTVMSRHPGDTRPTTHLREFIRTTYETVRGLPVWCSSTCRDPISSAREIMAAAAERIGSGVDPVEAERRRQHWMQRSLQVLKALGTIHKATIATTTVYTGLRSSTATSSSFAGGFSDSTNMSESHMPQQSSHDPEKGDGEGELEQEGDSALQYAHASQVNTHQTTPPTLLAGGEGTQYGGGRSSPTTNDDTTTSSAPSAFAPTKLPTFREIHNFWEDLQPPTTTHYTAATSGSSSNPLQTATYSTLSTYSYRWMLQYERRLGVLAVLPKGDSLISSGCRGEFDATEPVSVWSLGGYYKSSLWEAGRLGEQQHTTHSQEISNHNENSAASTSVDAHLGVVLQALTTRHQAWSTVAEKYTAPPSSLRTLKRRATAKSAVSPSGTPSSNTAVSASKGQSSRLAAVGFDPERKFAQSDLFFLFEKSIEPSDDSERGSGGVDNGALLSPVRALAHQAAIREEVGYILQETMAACTHLMMLSCKGGTGRWQHQQQQHSTSSPGTLSSSSSLPNHLSSQLLSHFSTSIGDHSTSGKRGVGVGLGMGASWVPPPSLLSTNTIRGMVLHPPPWYLCDPFSPTAPLQSHQNQPPILYFGQCLSEPGECGGSRGGALAVAKDVPEEPPMWGWDTSLQYAMFTNAPHSGDGAAEYRVVSDSILSRIASKLVMSSSLPNIRNTAPPTTSNTSSLMSSEAMSIRTSAQGFYSWLRGGDQQQQQQQQQRASKHNTTSVPSATISVHNRTPDDNDDGCGHKSSTSAVALAAAIASRNITLRRLMLTSAVLSVPSLAWVFDGAVQDILHHCLLPVLTCTLPSAATTHSTTTSPSAAVGRGSVLLRNVPSLSPKHALFGSSPTAVSTTGTRQQSAPNIDTSSLPAAGMPPYPAAHHQMGVATPLPSPLQPSHRSPNPISLLGGGGEQSPRMSNLFLGDGSPSRRGGGGGNPRNNQHTPSTLSLFVNSVSLPPIPGSDPTTPETPPLNATVVNEGEHFVAATYPLPLPPPPLLIFGVAPDTAAMDALLWSGGEENGVSGSVGDKEVYPASGFEVDWRRSPR